MEGKEWGLEGCQRVGSCEVRREEGESGMGGVARVEGLGGWVEEMKAPQHPRYGRLEYESYYTGRPIRTGGKVLWILPWRFSVTIDLDLSIKARY